MTQTGIIKRHLEMYGSISTYEAFQKYRITRVSARIWDLRHKYGMNIYGERKTAKTADGEPVAYVVYHLVKEGAENDGK